jgi:PIN domain nuclease of toxin-antitoxin system
MNKFVLDASALLAFLNAESGAERVSEILLGEQCVLLSVNLTETLTRLADWNVPLADANVRLEALKLPVLPFDQALAQAAAALRAPTRALGLSLGDRACLALAQQLNATALTADRPWRTLDLGISIECIRE